MQVSRIDFNTYVTIPVWYGCNNDCVICMLSGIKSDLPFIDFDVFRKFVLHIKEHLGCRNLILSGAEITTFDELDKYIAFVASLGWFHRIQIQTNGRRLKNRDYVASLIECGVNEFFVSIQGLENSHDAATRRRGSFRETIEGLDNLRKYPVNIMTNTVLTRANCHDVVPLLAKLSAGPVSETHLWNCFPMESSDTRDLLVSMKDCRELLRALIPVLEAAGKPLVLKNIPECLISGEMVFLDNGFPITLIGDTYWNAFDENRFGFCCHRKECGSQICWGLTQAHVQKYGDEREILSPIAR
jgi:sulfatase maturation enzyme AslB (radical SAM superfamily)